MTLSVWENKSSHRTGTKTAVAILMSSFALPLSSRCPLIPVLSSQPPHPPHYTQPQEFTSPTLPPISLQPKPKISYCTLLPVLLVIDDVR